VIYAHPELCTYSSAEKAQHVQVLKKRNMQTQNAENEKQLFHFVGQQALGSVIALNALFRARRFAVATTHLPRAKRRQVRPVWGGYHRARMV
jgi:hypothetical protein